MSERAILEAEPRELTGKKVKQLRREGWIPAVIYGQSDSLNIQIENLPLRRVLKDTGMTSLIDVTVAGKKRTVLAKDIQMHTTRGDLIHIDFYEVNMMEKLIVEASLVTSGIALPVADGIGTTPLVLYSIEIECLPDNLISEIVVDLSQITTPDDMIFVGDLHVPDGVEILTDPELVVARFEYLQEEVREEEAAEEFMFASTADEVEVIGRGRHDEFDDED